MTPAVINVVSATRTGDRALRLNFDDGKVQEEDIKPFFQHAVRPDIRAKAYRPKRSNPWNKAGD